MFRRVLRALRPPAVRLAHRLAVRADAARDDRHYLVAARLYEESLRLQPRHAARHIQAGHMFKEAGDLACAEPHYLAALAILPDDPDLALQIGHFYKVMGRLDEADSAYARAAELSGVGSSAALELARLRSADLHASDASVGGAFEIVPELLPRSLVPQAKGADFIHLAQLGRIDRTRWGTLRTVRGVTALRGFCVSAEPIVEFLILCDGQAIHRAGPNGGSTKFVFNVWHDFSHWPDGRHQLEFSCTGAQGARRSRREAVVVERQFAELDQPDSDALVTVDPADDRPLDAQIDSQPSVVRPAQRRVMASSPQAVLVQRVDQLGDLIVSIPAIRRLREIVSGARLVGLLSRANAALATTLDLFDEIIVVDFPEEQSSGRRVMADIAQRELAQRLASYRFDLAIDLSENGSTRDLLLLSGARRLFAVGSGIPWLSAGIQGATHDPVNGLEMVSPSSRMVGMIEWLGAVLRSHVGIVRRADPPASLARYGLAEGERYVLLHAGARLAFSRWPHFGALAAMLLERTGLTIVYIATEAVETAALPIAVSGSPRFRPIAGQLPFDDFDALLSGCAVMVGNDSGPKHLAALRGVPVVSIHMARVNWNEWGQELGGLIISRKVPCAGCGIHRDAEECGKDLVCIRAITPEEVLGAVTRLL